FFSSRRRHTRFSRDWSSDVCSSDLADRLEVGDDPVHGEHAVGGDEPEAGVGRRLELPLEVGHVVVGVAEALRLAEADAVDDAGEIGRASCRERVWIWVGGVYLKTKK